MKYSLQDAELMHRAHPDTFSLDPIDERSTLRPKDFAKLSFLFPDNLVPDDGCTGERMWVEVEHVVADGDSIVYAGALGNHPNRPALLGDLKLGDLVKFEPRHIYDIIHR